MVRAASPRGIRVDSDVSRELRPVNVSPAALTQAVFNLVQNAGEAITSVPEPRSKGLISISIQPSARGQDWAQISVSDNGPGMSAETMARCFEPYFSTKGRAVSTGLGLALVRGVAEAAGGVAECSSQMDRGTTFTLHLPPAISPEQTPRVTAVLDVSQPRLAAIVNVLLKNMHVTSGTIESLTPGEAAIWVTDQDPGHVLARFIADSSSPPSPRAAIIFQDGEPTSSHERSDAVIYAGRTPHASDIRVAVAKAISRARRTDQPAT